MIVTFDTTILVRATKRSTGPARRVVELLAAHPEHQIGLSSYVLSEVGKVLSYPRLQRLYGLNSEDIHAHYCRVALKRRKQIDQWEAAHPDNRGQTILKCGDLHKSHRLRAYSEFILAFNSHYWIRDIK